MRKPHTPAPTWTGYVAVRQNPHGHEWLDISTISPSHEAVARYAVGHEQAVDFFCPGWHHITVEDLEGRL